MKKLILLLLISIICKPLLSQKLPIVSGYISIEVKQQDIVRNDLFPWIKRTYNKANRAHTKLYFDTNGILIFKETFGKYHNMDLRLLDKVYQYYYNSNGNQIRIDEWETNEWGPDIGLLIFKNYSLFVYDSLTNNLIEERNFNAKTDTLYYYRKYKNGSNQNQHVVCSDSTSWTKYEHDNTGKIIRESLISQGKLIYEKIYSYNVHQSFEFFKRYSPDSTYTLETKTYKDDNIIQIEKDPINTKDNSIDPDKFSYKTIICYDKSGLISKVEYYEKYPTLFGNTPNFTKVGCIHFKRKGSRTIGLKMIQKINDELSNYW